MTVPAGSADSFVKAFDVYSGAANQALLGNKYSAGFDGIAYVDDSGAVLSLFNTEESLIQEYNRISPFKFVTNEMLVVGTMRFIADNGSTISLICYSSGNIMLGGIVDGVTFAADVTIAIYDYKNSKRSNTDKIKFGVDLTTTVLSTFAPGPIAGKSTRGLTSLGQEQLNESITNCISNIIGNEFDKAIDSLLP